MKRVLTMEVEQTIVEEINLNPVWVSRKSRVDYFPLPPFGFQRPMWQVDDQPTEFSSRHQYPVVEESFEWTKVVQTPCLQCFKLELNAVVTGTIKLH